MREVELAFARPSASWDEQPAESDSASKVIESREHPTILKTTLRLGPVCPTSSFSCEGAVLHRSTIGNRTGDLVCCKGMFGGRLATAARVRRFPSRRTTVSCGHS